jgi:hypothetical protein
MYGWEIGEAVDTFRHKEECKYALLWFQITGILEILR